MDELYNRKHNRELFIIKVIYLLRKIISIDKAYIRVFSDMPDFVDSIEKTNSDIEIFDNIIDRLCVLFKLDGDFPV